MNCAAGSDRHSWLISCVGVPNPAEAEDLAHDVFLRLSGISLEQLRSADAYIFQVAANLLRDRARRRKVRDAYAVAQIAAAEAEEFETHSVDPERIEAARRSVATLVARLRELPERTREIFILYRIENVPRRNIAQAFGLSISTVEKEIARATAYLMSDEHYPR